MMAPEPTRKLIRDYSVAIIAAVAVALFIRFFIIEAYRIPSIAMKPTLEPGDVIFVAKWPFGLRAPGAAERFTSGRLPHYGEVVVFSLPNDPGRDYIKRVIALPGDTVEVHDGRFTLNGQIRTLPADRNAICGKETTPLDGKHTYGVCWEPPVMENFGPEKVPADHVFVLGDLRSQATDIRKAKSWGMIPLNSVKAVAMWIWLSIEPPGQGAQGSWFSRIRFERMMRGIE